MNILVSGYGRIAKVLTRYLLALGANVTVCARKFSDIAWAKIMGCTAVLIDEIDKFLNNFDTIVNTVPAQLFNREKLMRLKNNCLIVDLASKTGISDMELAKSTGAKVIWALSLPGKVAPITAGHIIADTISNIIAEKNNEKGGTDNE
jgi:dipicolinate synthase subunit A